MFGHFLKEKKSLKSTFDVAGINMYCILPLHFAKFGKIWIAGAIKSNEEKKGKEDEKRGKN